MVRVNIDLEKLRAHLAQADQRHLSADEVLRFLADAGFRQTSQGWIGREEDLGQLDPSEVISAEPMD